jgi:hypothetical protein
MLLFESEEDSGGGYISREGCSYIKKENQLIIEFEDPECVGRSVNFGKIHFIDKVYEAERYKKPLMGALAKCSVESMKKDKLFDDFKLKITFYQSDSKESLEESDIKLYINFLLDHKDFEFYKLDYGSIDPNRDNGSMSYVIVSNSLIDHDKVIAKKEIRSKFKDRRVQVEKIKETKSILVESKKHKDIVSLYFENSTSGKIKVLDVTQDFYFIEFEDKNCFDNLMNQQKAF